MNRISLLVAATLLVAVPSARAQSATPALASRHAVQAPVTLTGPGPAATSLAAGARPVAAERLGASAVEEEAVALRRRAMSRPQTYMVIGGAAFLAGAIIGDDAGTIVMVGGAAIGLYGLYLYLQQ